MKYKPQAVSIDSLETDLGQYWLILKRRFVPAASVFSIILLLAYLLSLFQKPVYKAQGKLLLKVDQVASLTGVGTGLGEFSTLTLQSSPLRTESEILLSASLLEKTIAQLNLRDEKGDLLKPEDLRERLEVEPVTGADVLQVRFEGDEPETAAAIVNELMNIYVENNVSMSRQQVTEARQVLEGQLPKAEAELQAADARLRAFKEQNRITNLEEESRALVSNASQLDSDIVRARQSLADATFRLDALQNKIGLDSDAALELSSLSQSPGVQKALQDLQEVQNQLTAERSRYEDQYPTVVNLRRQEDFLQQLLQERVRETLGQSSSVADSSLQVGATEQDLIQQLVNAEVQYLGLVGQLNELMNTRELYQQRSVTLPSLEQQLGRLQRNLEITQSTYQNLTRTFQDVQVAEQQNTGNANIIEMASVPSQPVESRKILLRLLGGMLGLLVALSTIILLEIIDRSVKTSREVRRLFEYPYLGTIPQLKGLVRASYINENASGLLLRGNDFFNPVMGAAYRSLQANLKLVNGRETLKTIVITSSVPQEGKSTIAANLAATMAQLNRRVLLVDADLYDPQQHRLWDLNNNCGLTDIIVNQVSLSTAVHAVTDNLDLVTSGSAIAYPLAVLDSAAMQNLLASAAQQYDFVILDASPLMIEAEALTLGKITDGLVLVTRVNVLDVGSAKRTNELLQQSGQRVLGIVINSTTSEAEFKQLIAHQRNQRKKFDFFKLG